MADQVFPTKGNLLNVKKSLSLAKVGYELLDRKRNVLISCELPKVTLDPPDSSIPYGFENTDGNVDVAYISFGRVKQMTAMLAEVDNSVFRLANAIKKTQTRANALKNIVIPRYETTAKFIENSLEEKEREEFSRQKVIKNQKERKKYKGRAVPAEKFTVPDVSEFVK